MNTLQEAINVCTTMYLDYNYLLNPAPANALCLKLQEAYEQGFADGDVKGWIMAMERDASGV